MNPMPPQREASLRERMLLVSSQLDSLEQHPENAALAACICQAMHALTEDYRKATLATLEQVANTAALLHRLANGCDMLITEENWKKREFRDRYFGKIKEHLRQSEETLYALGLRLSDELCPVASELVGARE